MPEEMISVGDLASQLEQGTCEPVYSFRSQPMPPWRENASVPFLAHFSPPRRPGTLQVYWIGSSAAGSRTQGRQTHDVPPLARQAPPSRPTLTSCTITAIEFFGCFFQCSTSFLVNITDAPDPCVPFTST